MNACILSAIERDQLNVKPHVSDEEILEHAGEKLADLLEKASPAEFGELVIEALGAENAREAICDAIHRGFYGRPVLRWFLTAGIGR